MIRHWPIVATVALLWLSVAVSVCRSYRQNDHHLVYPLDDTYITMAMAKNLAEHGVWGVTRHGFTSSSSSILWPIVIAAVYRITGTNETAPIACNVVLATLVIIVCGAEMNKRGLRSFPLFLVLLVLAALIPLQVLVVIGLEHTLHLLLTLAVVARATEEIDKSKNRSSEYPSALLLMLVALLVAARYEGLFLVLMLCLVWAARKGWRASMTLPAAAAVPVVGYGIVSVAYGWHFFPNSILLKGAMTPAVSAIAQRGLFSHSGAGWLINILGYGAYDRFLQAPAVLFLLLLMLVLKMSRSEDRWSEFRPGPVLIALFGGTSLLHMQFAGVGWLFRYEAYLVGLGLFVLSIVILDGPAGVMRKCELKTVAVTLLFAFLGAGALGERAVHAAVMAPRAARNIYEQQYQMGLFLREYFQGDKVALNDVGAANFLADVQCLDLDGLANKEAFYLKLKGQLTPDAIASLSPNSGVAILYKRIFATHGLPPGWRIVGQWKIEDNVVCGDDTVFFYSTEPGDADNLVAKLRQFGSRLPADVEQVILDELRGPAGA